MRIDFDLEDDVLRAMVERVVKDYVYNEQSVRQICRQAIYQMTAEAAQKVLVDAPETLRELVTKELKVVALEAAQRDDY